MGFLKDSKQHQITFKIMSNLVILHRFKGSTVRDFSYFASHQAIKV